ncbi:MAG TPA: YebC/PmpR family DNA-binding transcriptional regulator [Polyangia bacterium]|jgi:YebC/PmpR family DNA-binding regulatory protein
MGRIFETRKATMFKRWDKISKAFTRIGKDIAIAVKSGGPSPDSNSTLRRVLQNARAANMPKDRIENAIKKASGQGAESYDIVVYEGYAPHGIAIIVETATNNVVRTVANVRNAFKSNGGAMGNEGSVAFQFKHMGVFRLTPEAVAGKDLDALELDLIDHGLEEMGEGTNDKGEPQLIVRGSFVDFGKLQAAIEARGIAVQSAESEYVAQNLLSLPEDKSTEVLELVDALEQDEDVQHVFHNLS